MQILAAALAALFALGQQPTPQPFPRPTQPSRPAPSDPVPEPPSPAQPAPAARTLAPDEPSQETLGLPVYPAATYLASYQAGQGQRYYLFGTNASYAEIVAYYRTYLKQRGTQVFDQPATHMFDVGRFREATMVYPPGVTVKDYTWNGSEGYLHVGQGGQPQRYRTIIQLVPPPSGG